MDISGESVDNLLISLFLSRYRATRRAFNFLHPLHRQPLT